jgi:flagellar motor switch/type III secretory pathway protein FliN
MAEKSDDFEIKLSEEDSLTDILVEPGNTELLDDDQITDDSSEWLAESDLDDMYTESEELDSEPDEEPIDLGMDEIGDLVEDLKMDFQQEETDESVNGEKDMVFEEEETEEESSDSVESLLDELDGDESEENSDSDDSFVDDIDGEINKALDVGESEASDDAEISGESTEEEVEELDLSEDLDPEELKDSSGETDAVEESVESLSAEEADTESSEVLEMLHDPEISEDSEDSEDSEANDTEDLELGIDALDDIKDSEEADTELVDIGESKIDELKFDNETEENSASETSADSPEENEVTGAQMDSSDSVEVEPEIEKTPVIEKVESKMPIEIEASETSAVPLDADMLLKFHHEAVVEIARTQLTGEEITQITYGSIIELDKVAGEPVNLVLDGKTIALGEVIQINNDKLGIRIVGIVQE